VPSLVFTRPRAIAAVIVTGAALAALAADAPGQPTTPTPLDQSPLAAGPHRPAAAHHAWLQGSLPALDGALPPRRSSPPRAVFPIRGAVDYGTEINRFGVPRSGHTHGGQDVFAAAGTPLLAVREAVVVEAGSDGGRGNHIAIYSRATRRTYAYFHMQEPTSLTTGARVRAGRVVGRVGCSGSCQGDHLHFEVHRGRGGAGPAEDPLPLLRRWQNRR